MDRNLIERARDLEQWASGILALDHYAIVQDAGPHSWLHQVRQLLRDLSAQTAIT